MALGLGLGLGLGGRGAKGADAGNGGGPGGGGGSPPALSAGIVGDGAWTWFNDPRAISINGTDQVIGAISSAGRLLVYPASTSPVDLRGSLFQQDDHANPSFLRRASDGRILAFASAHTGSGLYTYLSTNPDDASAFGAETNIDAQVGRDGYSYTNPIQMTGEAGDPIYLFFRASDGGAEGQVYFTKSTDGGATWSAATKLFANNNDSVNFPPYFRCVQNGDSRIDFCLNDGSPDATATNSLYHCYYEGGTFYKTDGTALSLPILPATDLTPIYDGSGAGGPSWVWDIAIDASGYPVIVHAAFPSTTDHRYRYARWNGSSWVDTQICTAGSYLYSGQPHYSGGVCLDHADPDKVFASRPGDYGPRQIWRYETSDGGSTFDAGTKITSGVNALRPTMVRGQSVEPKLAFFSGRYTSFTDFSTDLILADSSSAAVASSDFEAAALVIGADEQPDGSTSFVDESVSYRAITANGNVQIDTARSKFGTGSILFDGSGDYLSCLNDSALSIANSIDKTFDVWVYVASFGSASQTIFDKRPASGSMEFALTLNPTGHLTFWTWKAGNTLDVNIAAGTAIASGGWHHVRMCRASGHWYMFVDGNLEANAAETATPAANTEPFRIGWSGSSTESHRSFNGSMDEVYILHGLALSTTSFTPPTAKYPRS